MRGRGEHSARRIRWQALFAAAGRNPWCACRRSASLLFKGRPYGEGLSYSGVAKLGCEGASRERRRIIRPRESGGGGPCERKRSMVEGASEMELRCRCRKSSNAQARRRILRRVAARAPSTAPERGPPSPLSAYALALRRTQTRRSSPSERRRVAGQDGSSRLGGETHEHHGALTSPCVARRCGATRDTTKERDRRRPRAPARA